MYAGVRTTYLMKTNLFAAFIARETDKDDRL